MGIKPAGSANQSALSWPLALTFIVFMPVERARSPEVSRSYARTVVNVSSALITM